MSHEHVCLEKNPSHYAIIDGKKVPLTPEQRKAWNEMINKTRRYARNYGACGQPDFRKCRGDCALCPYDREGVFVYADDHARYAAGFARGRYAPAHPGETPEGKAENADKWAWLYRAADKTVLRGKDILQLYLEDGLSARQIADHMGIAKSTVTDRLNRLLAFIREHRDELL